MSAYSDFSYAQQAVKLGAREYLLKPLVMSDLLDAIGRAREANRHATLVQQGQRTMRDALEDCVFGNESVDEKLLEYIDTQLYWPISQPMTLVALHGSETQVESWRRLCRAEEMPRNETITLGDNVLTVFADGSEHLTFELAKRLLPQLADEEGYLPVAIGSVIDGFASMRERVQALLAHMDDGLLVNRLIRYEELDAWPMELLPYPIELETAARMAISRCDHTAVRARMRDFLRLFTSGRF